MCTSCEEDPQAQPLAMSYTAWVVLKSLLSHLTQFKNYAMGPIVKKDQNSTKQCRALGKALKKALVMGIKSR